MWTTIPQSQWTRVTFTHNLFVTSTHSIINSEYTLLFILIVLPKAKMHYFDWYFPFHSTYYQFCIFNVGGTERDPTNLLAVTWPRIWHNHLIRREMMFLKNSYVTCAKKIFATINWAWMRERFLTTKAYVFHIKFATHIHQRQKKNCSCVRLLLSLSSFPSPPYHSTNVLIALSFMIWFDHRMPLYSPRNIYFFQPFSFRKFFIFKQDLESFNKRKKKITYRIWRSLGGSYFIPL